MTLETSRGGFDRFGAFSFQGGRLASNSHFSFQEEPVHWTEPNLYFSFQTFQFPPSILAVGRWTLGHRHPVGAMQHICCSVHWTKSVKTWGYTAMYCWVYWFFRDGIFTTWVYLIFMVHHIALHELADVLGYCSKPTSGVTLGLNSSCKIPLGMGCRISAMHIMGNSQRLLK